MDMTPHFPIYMDYGATNPVDQRVVDAMIPWLREHFGNPASRSHAWGWEAGAGGEEGGGAAAVGGAGARGGAARRRPGAPAPDAWGWEAEAAVEKAREQV